MYPQYSGPSVARSGVHPAVVVLMWIFVGWPMSWLLLFLFAPLGILFGLAITVGMIVLLVAYDRPATPPAVINVGSLPPVPPFPSGPYPAVPPHLVAPGSASRGGSAPHVVRAPVESLAEVNAVGGCGWCGHPSAHVDPAGNAVHPRHWHTFEIEERIRATLAH